MHFLLVFFNFFEPLFLKSLALLMLRGELSDTIFMLTHPLEQLVEILVVLFGETSHIGLRPLEEFLVLLGQVISYFLFYLGKLLLLLFHD